MKAAAAPGSLSVLLLQARRAEDPMKGQEVRCFADRTGLAEEQIVSWDLLQGAPSIAQVRRHEALMMGGSGEFLVSKRNLPDFPRLLELLTEVVEAGHPTFASCFGFQCMVRALGGEIVHDPGRAEVGTFEIRLTGEGRDDPLTGSLPPSFPAQLGRKDRAGSLPAGTVNLAFSHLTPYQAFRVDGKPIWATQFHPELDREANRERFLCYLDAYRDHMSEEEQRSTLDGFRDSPEAESLLPRFLRLVFG